MVWALHYEAAVAAGGIMCSRSLDMMSGVMVSSQCSNVDSSTQLFSHYGSPPMSKTSAERALEF